MHFEVAWRAASKQMRAPQRANIAPRAPILLQGHPAAAIVQLVVIKPRPGHQAAIRAQQGHHRPQLVFNCIICIKS